MEQGVLLGGEGDVLPLQVHLLGGQGQGQPVQLHPVSGSHAATAAADEGHGLGVHHRQVEGLGDVVVRPQLVAQQGVLLVGQGGEEEDGHVLGAPQGPAHAAPVQLGHHNVQQNRVKLLLLGQFQGLRPVFRLDGADALAGKVVAQDLPQTGVVLGNQNTGLHAPASFPPQDIRGMCILCVIVAENIPPGYKKGRACHNQRQALQPWSQAEILCCMPFRAPALSREKRITPDRMAPPAVDTRKGMM